jgi:hypothetical protein
MKLPAIGYTMWHCGDDECDCAQLHIYDKETNVLLAEGPYTSDGERDWVGTARAIVKFMGENPRAIHEFSSSIYYALSEVVSLAERYEDLCDHELI